ncbi:Y-family DNA polymerase [Gluconobacter wancherniae]|uniref:DNA-directed DNA polymerase n=1 Tax=Gluconobacter wancherniae NBRC 103581 TaxID=656744 RepID=A0A511AYS5_9PROT|nr:Y-family DNA polymerase [Gluconobacter wancherniae]MBF0853527.1 Y-family DNA polymerase [Gluconobacter wancherniae]GBD55729.1 DNA polymerase V subunit UmuC [Gluconobacter wancherniae NBRC 103581]GBR66238.1 SOS mutagenesis protein UmuC [Gluconobacter wancherniae NBRC 103581]GEK93365.1 DNA polymerase V subunit UmuC [Gluconobacter wancherniae NBRC 103581]
MHVFGLIDGNSFYCSCQRAFEPRLKHAPVVVLSNNDGCAIARTHEAKAAGIRMGDPWHLARKRPESAHVAWYSSNYALYADMSRRMYQVLSERVPAVEPYFIGEMFLDLSNPPGDLYQRCSRLRQDVLKHAKIPTCVGWGPTKTIAKLTNGLAKAHPELNGLCDLTDNAVRQHWYARTSIDEVWGIGRQTTQKLQEMGIRAVADFVTLDAKSVRQMLTVVGGRVQAELRGQSCLPLLDVSGQRKSIASTRTFGRLLTEWHEIREAIAHYASRAAEKLREDNLEAAHLSVLIQTNPHNGDPWYARNIAITIEPTSDTRDLVQHATKLGRAIWLSGYRYFKAGVILTDLRPAGTQGLMFSGRPPEKSATAMLALDVINARFGSGTLRTASTGQERTWSPRQAILSPRYTTRLEEIAIARSW